MFRAITIIYEEDDVKLMANGEIPDSVPNVLEESKMSSETMIYDDILKVVGQSLLEKILEFETQKKLKEEVIVKSFDGK